MTPLWPHIAILSFVTLQRLAELSLASANTRALKVKGAVEVAPGHYPLIVAVHVAWLGTLWWLAPGEPINGALLGLFFVLQLLRIWVIRTLGPRWTTRIIVLSGEAPVATGPYRFLHHPNYLVVIGEILVLPLAFGLWKVALLFSALNLAVLSVRIRAENRALGR
jgi:methyltransferase